MALTKINIRLLTLSFSVNFSSLNKKHQPPAQTLHCLNGMKSGFIRTAWHMFYL